MRGGSQTKKKGKKKGRKHKVSEREFLRGKGAKNVEGGGANKKMDRKEKKRGRREKKRKEGRKKRREEERRYKEFDVDRTIKPRPIDLKF